MIVNCLCLGIGEAAAGACVLSAIAFLRKRSKTKRAEKAAKP